MKKKYIFITIVLVFFLILSGLVAIRKKRMAIKPQPLPVLDAVGKSPLVKNIKTLTNNGGRVDWSPGGDLIAFDRISEDGYYDVWVMQPDGTDQKCLTCGKTGLPQKHNGNPSWHPSGEYIVFQSQDLHLKGLPIIFSEAERMMTGPGIGINNNIWLMTKNGERFWQLTSITDKMGVLHPHFSHDGNKLLWSERVNNEPKPTGQWVVKITDCILDENQPHLINIQQYQPEDLQFYEIHGFTPDNQKIIFSATPDGLYKHLDVYLYNLETEELKQFTGPDEEWDEHAQLSPDGTRIVWMSSREIGQELKQDKGKTEFWLMSADGSDKQRLTYFNDPTAPEYISITNGMAAKDNSWSPDGKRLVAYISRGTAELKDRPELIVLIELVE